MTPKQIEALKLALEALKNYAWHGEACPQHPTYSEPENYPQCTCGFDKAITALKEALAEHAMKETQRLGQEIEQEPLAWRNAAIRVGEDLSSVGPDGYYDMTAQQWLDWAMEQQPHGKNSLAQPEQEPDIYPEEAYEMGLEAIAYYAHPPQRKPLTLGQKQRLWSSVGDKPTLKDRVNAYGLAIEAAHGIKGVCLLWSSCR